MSARHETNSGPRFRITIAAMCAAALDASVRESAAKLTGVWLPNRVWKKFIDDTLVACGKKAQIL